MTRIFPKDFIWAAGNSAIQCEGGNKNSDWHFFEKDGFVKSGESIGAAVDHYHRFEEDFKLAKSLGQNGHRFTIEWSRIEPKEGQFDQKEIEHYRQVLLSLRRLGLKSVTTLHHFSNPTWFALQGGWEQPNAPQKFERYAAKVIAELGDLIDYWVVINEPNTYIGLGYLVGELPPLKHNPLKALKVLNNMAKAFNLTADKIHQHYPKSPVGNANNCQLLTSQSGKTTGPLAKIVNYVSDYYFIGKTADRMDFTGLNFYFPKRILKKKGSLRTDLDWEIYPRGLYDSATNLWERYHKPLFILENGLADKEDVMRANFIEEHLKELHNAITDGVKVIGYTYWSLTDNFELAKGFGPKFGLIRVNPNNFERTIKDSARIYAKICKGNQL